MEAIKIVGHIDIPTGNVKLHKNTCHDYYCDDCNDKVNSSFGDIRHEVIRTNRDGSTSNRFICSYCLDELFGDHEPKSVFD
jgi:hypothetical protein